MVEILGIILTNYIADYSNENPSWIDSVQVSDLLVLMIPAVHIKPLSRDTLLLAATADPGFFLGGVHH